MVNLKSPALTKASIGVAIGAGSDVALDAADVILVKSSLMDLVRSIRLSRATLRNIKENLFWAFFYNIIMIPIAAGIFSFAGLYKMKPWYGALAMALSSTFVVFNALRLNLINADKDSFKRKTIDIDMDLEGGDNMNKAIFSVDGMMCDKCVMHVEEACMKVSGVKSAKASLKKKNVVVKYEDTINLDEVAKNIVDAGYEVK